MPNHQWFLNGGLIDKYNCACRGDLSMSGCSLTDKRRIDSMFEESRSVVSGSSRRKASIISTEIPDEERKRFLVTYLGSVSVGTEVTSLEALQRPLKWLCLARARKGGSWVRDSRLEIKPDGLHLSCPDGQRTHPFTTIAVWAALRLTRKEFPEGGRYAFLPPTARPEATDKGNLFWKPPSREEALLLRIPDAPPLLAVIAEGSRKRLRCHCFLTASAGEAVVAAATLYAALVESAPPALHSSPQSPGRAQNIPVRAPSRISRDSGGDVLTRVAIPRSRCYLRTGSGHADALGQALDSGTEDATGGGLLGLDQLFLEFRRQEGLYDIDEILDNVVDSDGMSFNDLRPIYKEFVLKLALLLTKDELYQRSKSIMRRQRSIRTRLKRRKGRGSKTFAVGGNFKRALKKSVSGLKASKSMRDCTEFTSVLLPSCGVEKQKNTSVEFDGGEKQAGSNGSTRIGDLVKVSLKRIIAPKNKNRSRADVVGVPEQTADSGSENSRHFPSEYPSCSECSYNSETCTCTSAEKCYCPLGKAKQCLRPPPDFTLPGGVESCDRPSAFEQLKLCGFAVSESSYSRSESPTRDWDGDGSCRKRLDLSSGPKIAGTGSSESLEFLRKKYMKIHETGGLNTNSKLDNRAYGMGTRGERKTEKQLNTDMRNSSARCRKNELDIRPEHFDRKCFGNEKEKKILVVSARDPWGKVVYMGATCRKPKTNGIADDCAQASEALSVKKSAEIASLFSQIRNDEMYDTSRRSTYSNLCPMKDTYTEANLENSLGYFP